MDFERLQGLEPDTALRARRSFLAVNEIDRIVLTGSGGNLHPFIPLDPFHGVHRAYAWQGVGPARFVQVNASAAQHADGRYQWTWPATQVRSYDGLILLATIADPLSGCLINPAWEFAATRFARLAYRTHAPNGRAEYWIEASPTGHDRFARHRIDLRDIWERLAPARDQRAQLKGPLPESTRDQGTVYEELVAADLIR